ncbi:co-chaperone YbbN [Rhodoplanes elegans]|uniref:Co-chaperone YbbN n=1 Tax=Rhodoplanes elegans TaxID=29408 RepID=A0A327KA74_9BRAD|nr:co-chaperone YbbN [Rhodoplanes elegans]MBK5960130.1 co-chaperone YbbN [Rhodoplanes elegans]RAI34836.1 co-chaperone YbbN [Rhodoplanes elegans]
MLQDGGAAVAADGLIKDTTTQEFAKDVIEESRRQPVLLDLWADWCQPCKQLTPVLEKLVKAARGKVKLVKLNIEQHRAVFQQLQQQLGIQSIPAVLAFADGRIADGFMGALPESQIVAFLDRLTRGRAAPEGDPVAEALEAADAALVDGDAGSAAQIYAQVLQHDPENLHAMAGLVRCYVETGALDQARQTLAMVPEAKRAQQPVAAAAAALEVAEQAAALGPLVELEKKVAADPLDHQARYDLALALAAKGRKAETVDHLLEIVRRDRKWNDDGARKQLVQLFEAWGPTDESTVSGRRRLSSILFA